VKISRSRLKKGRSPKRSSADVLKSLQKVIRALECFSLEEPRLPLSEIARRAGLPLSTAHRILATLRQAGLVEQEGERDLYRLGLKLLELGSVVLANMEVHREALPFIEELVRETGETVHLGVFDGTQVVSIEKMDSPHGLASNITIGKGAPAYCTGVSAGGRGGSRLSTGTGGVHAADHHRSRQAPEGTGTGAGAGIRRR
jgi:DNA-binding MarR family transcriptional regulator